MPPLNGSGTAIDTSAMGLRKMIAVAGSAAGAHVAIEASVDGGVTFAPVLVLPKDHATIASLVVEVVAQFMRVHVVGRTPKAPFTCEIDIGSAEAAVTAFTAIPLPAGDGPGPTVEIASFGDASTFVASGTFPDATITLEISQDGLQFVPVVTFRHTGAWHTTIREAFVRAYVVRAPGAPFTATLAMGAVHIALPVGDDHVDGDAIAMSAEARELVTDAPAYVHRAIELHEQRAQREAEERERNHQREIEAQERVRLEEKEARQRDLDAQERARQHDLEAQERQRQRAHELALVAADRADRSRLLVVLTASAAALVVVGGVIALFIAGQPVSAEHLIAGAMIFASGVGVGRGSADKKPPPAGN
jgi:hypothetical protein